MEVVKVCIFIFDIEIIISFIDESGILENKRFDFLDIDINSLEDGIDFDIFFDYGDEDDDGNFDFDNFGGFRRKIWFLEIDRDRLLLDSLIVFERDFKESCNKGDNVDGKFFRDGEFC